MRLTKQRIVLLLLMCFVTAITLIAAQKSVGKDTYVVENFAVNDVPADDGVGLVLSWKPLSRDKRVIEYRIYRGTTKDQLFFLSSIPVNVKTGVAADSMFYYDNSWSEFIDIKSPGKLKLEKRQPSGSPLYRHIPRNVEIAAKLSQKYTLLSIIDKKNYYHKTKKSFSASSADSSAYAGLLLRQQTLLAKLQPGETYFYTIVAVDERSNYHTYAPITSGSPKDNPPDPAVAFHSVVVEDSLKMQFEWEYPLFNEDLAMYQIMMMPPLDKEEWNQRRATNNFEGITMVPVDQGQVSSVESDAAKNYSVVDLKPLIAQGITMDRIKQSRFVLSLMDYSQFESYSDQVIPNVVKFAKLPPKPVFWAEDKPNDKGDRITVTWDDPIAFITKTSAVGGGGNKLLINYQLNKTDNQTIKNLYFKFFKKGDSKAFATLDEFYPDNKLVLTIPKGYDYKQGLTVKIDMVYSPKINKEYSLQQDLAWDPQMMALMPGKSLLRNGLDVSGMSNVVYRKRTNTPFYTNIKKNTSYDNSLDVTIPYEVSIFKIVNGFNYIKGDSLITYSGKDRYSKKVDAKTPRGSYALVSADIDVIFDKTNERTVTTSIYLDEAIKTAKQDLDEATKDLAKMKSDEAELKAAPASPEQAKQLADLIKKMDRTEKTIAILNGEYIKKANSFTSDRARMKYIAETREADKRKQSFLVVRTDGKGLFTAADENKDSEGNYEYITPISNWFDTNKIVTLIATLLFGAIVFAFIKIAQTGRKLYIRPIAGLIEIDNAIGRATEMGRPMLYCMGAGGLSEASTIASLGILGLVAKRAAEYDTRLIVPCYDYIVMPVAQEIVREAHFEVGRPDSYDRNDVFYMTNVQFAYVAGVNGIQIRERCATNFFLGSFAAESLLMTETGNFIGAVQIAGTDSTTQIPFFITTCDYTLIGEELYAASAYLKGDPMQLGTLKGQDYYKFLILAFILLGTTLASFHITAVTRLFPTK